MSRPMLRPEAYRGIAGDFTRTIRDHTEADPAGILISFLVFSGNVIGRQRYVSIGATRHYGNLFCLLVGPTSKGRKGTAISEVKRLFRTTFGVWAEDCHRSGLSSGEGVINDLRDPVTEDEELSYVGKSSAESPPVEDRRRLYEEAEFGKLLSKNQTRNSILSPVLRSAWDSENLSNITRSSPMTASDPHVSIAASITAEELVLVMPENDRYNGFINRFGMVWVERDQLIPNPLPLPNGLLSELRTRLRGALEKGKNGTLGTKNIEVGFQDEKARKTWERIYREIEESEHDLGEFFSRFSPYVRRIALIYATLDGRTAVSTEDLEASKAVVDYFRDSVEAIYGTLAVNSKEAKILERLGLQSEVSTSELYSLFNRHITKSDLNKTLQALSNKGLVSIERRDGDGSKGTYIHRLTELGRETLATKMQSSQIR